MEWTRGGLLLCLWQLSHRYSCEVHKSSGIWAWWYLLISGGKKPQIWLLLRAWTMPLTTLEVMRVHSLPWHSRGCPLRLKCWWRGVSRSGLTGLSLGHLDDGRLTARPQEVVTAASFLHSLDPSEPCLSSHASPAPPPPWCAWHRCLHSCQNPVRITVSHLLCYLPVPGALSPFPVDLLP